MGRDIKDYREKELKSYVIGNILLILLGTGLINSIVTDIGRENLWEAMGILVNSGVVFSLVYIYTCIVDALVPGDMKNTIVWWKEGSPGSKIFSQIKEENRDNRFTAEDVVEKYSEVYRKIAELDVVMRGKIENAAWYKAYQRNENSAIIIVSQRDWLLCRDMCVITLWILFGTISTFSILGMCIPCWLIAVIIGELVCTWIAARIKSRRFAYNVVAKDIQQK